MSFSIIAAVGRNMELGKKGQLCFRLPEDMKYFKQTTLDHPVIMGGNTFRSLKAPLPGRTNVVLSRSDDFPEDVVVIHSLMEAINEFSRLEDEVFVIGGGAIYEMFLPFCDKIYLTEIDAFDKEADVFFPKFDQGNYEKTVVSSGKSKNHGIPYDMVVYTKKEGL
ncbi:dihydrofolate reductase [Candidatus Saccharibacteria bacterium]|nr:dihydrofolate reductase [Candidatus Saccharibacteria bacterium]